MFPEQKNFQHRLFSASSDNHLPEAFKFYFALHAVQESHTPLSSGLEWTQDI